MTMIRFLAVILLCQAAGELLVGLARLPFPGPVVGMALLLAWLAWRGGPEPEVEKTVLGLLRHMSLLFVPAGVGVVVHLATLGRSALAVGCAVVVSTLATIAVAGLVMQALTYRSPAGRPAGRSAQVRT